MKLRSNLEVSTGFVMWGTSWVAGLIRARYANLREAGSANVSTS